MGNKIGPIDNETKFRYICEMPLHNPLNCFFVSDLHGQIDRYEKLFDRIASEKPNAVFITGDLLPAPYSRVKCSGYSYKEFFHSFLFKNLIQLKSTLKESYPAIFIIMGNDDPKMEEKNMKDGEKMGIWKYCHLRSTPWRGYTIYGYTCIPPSPFRLKDWERFDVTHFVRPGCISPEDGAFTSPIPRDQDGNPTFHSIEEDLENLAVQDNLDKSIFLFHSPPHRCLLDRAALDGMKINDIQVDVHVGSVAIQRFIQKHQPYITLHGHIHESTRITGSWKQTFNCTLSFNASHDGPELSIIRFDPQCPQHATRELI